jgi:hypothetical protein
MFDRQTRLSPAFFLGSSEVVLDQEQLAYLPKLWKKVVYDYSSGRLSYPDDKLPAISAIASEFQRLSGDTYLAGLWRSQLVHDLQWWKAYNFERPDPAFQRRAYRIPTWSWASIDARITSYDSSKYQRISECVSILDCEVNLVSTLAPFGHINGGHLTIRGAIKCVSLRDSWDNFGTGLEAAHLYHSRTIGVFWSDPRWESPADVGSIRRRLGLPVDRGPCGSLDFLCG